MPSSYAAKRQQRLDALAAEGGRAPVDLSALDEQEVDLVDLHRVPPHRATKPYLCPGCNHEIATRTAHVVVVPKDQKDLRRHWHTACWENRRTRQPGRSAAR